MKSTACILVLLSLLACSSATCPSPCKCPAPEVVDCSKAGLTSIPPLPSTTLNLDLSLNKIASIPSKAFAAAPKLLFLNLNNNDLSSLSPEAFIGIPNLQNLSLANNGFRDDVDISSISASNSLLDLNLANNHLTKIPAVKTTSLRRLTLSGNTIRSAAFPASFSSCYDLLSVLLSGNQISTIAANDFDSLTSLKIVSMNFGANRISSIDPKALVTVGLYLNNLNLNRNRLTSAALTSALKGYLQVPSIALSSLSVSSNAITKFDRSVLEPLQYTLFNSLQLDGHRQLELDQDAFDNIRKSLKVLSLRDCGLTSLPAAVSSLSNLETLRLDGNSFSTLPSALPPKLLDLSVTRNSLQGWSSEALSRLDHLQQLDLSMNSLETVTDTASNPLHSCTDRLKMLSLTGNPFNCSCDLAWFVTWAGSKAGKAVRDFRTLKCTAPESVAGVFLKDVNMSDCGSGPHSLDESDGLHDHKEKTHADSTGGHHHEQKQPHHKKQKQRNKHSKTKSSEKQKHHHKKHHKHHHKGEL